MTATLDTATLARLAGEPVDWRFKGLPPAWSGRSPAQICASAPDLFEAGPLGPVCVLRDDALTHNLATMARWCDRHGVQLAPHGKTHMSPQLAARLASELNGDPNFDMLCWVDSVRGVGLMTDALSAAGLRRPLDVCVEVGAAGGRTGCRSEADVDAVARAVVGSPHLRLTGVSGYEAALGHDISPAGRVPIRDFLSTMRSAVLRLADVFETDDVVVTAGGSTHFDLVAETLTGWPDGLTVRTVLRSGCYLTHDDGLYQRTSPLAFTPALSVWAQVCSIPEPGLALLTMGRRDVAFDQDLPIPRGFPDSTVTKLNDQHAFLRPGPTARLEIGDWVEFGISHPCTVFDKWQMIPVLDADNRVIELIRTFF